MNGMKYREKARYNAYYHPQSNPSERFIQTIKTMLCLYVTDNHRKWDENLTKFACATRTANMTQLDLARILFFLGRTWYCMERILKIVIFG